MVIDEVTMGDSKIFEILDRTFKIVKDNHPGGVTMLFSGDRRQCLSVVPRAGKAESLHHTSKMSHLWQEVSCSDSAITFATTRLNWLAFACRFKCSN